MVACREIPYLRAPMCNSLVIFAGVNMFQALLTITSARAARRALKNDSEKGTKHIYAQEHRLNYHYYHFGGH